MNDGTRRFVVVVAAAAVLAAAVLVLTAHETLPTLLGFVVLTVLVALSERVEVVFRWDRTTAGFTLIEVAISAGLLLAAHTHLVGAVALGMLIVHVAAVRNPVKVTYNVAYAVLATSLAALALERFPPVGPLVGGRPVAGVFVAMLVYAAASLGGFLLLLRFLRDRIASETFRDQLPMHLIATIGMTSVGVVIAALYETRPELVVFVAAPAVAIHLAMRSSLEAASLLAEQRAEHDRLLRVVNGASDGIVLLDGAGVVQVWNPAMERLAGRHEGEAVGRPVASVLTDDVRPGGGTVTGRWTLEDARDSSPFLEQDAKLADADGRIRDVRESHAFTFDDRGRCTGAVVVVRDVSRQRELERLRSDFVARVSHELRTPLTPIRGFASVLLRRGDLLSDDQRAEALTRIVDRADHLHALVEDLLLVTRLEHRDVEELVHPGPTDLRTLVRSVVDEVIAGSGRTITVAVADDLPPAHADGDRTRQVLDAVLDNAVRYSPDDSPVEVEVDRDGDDVRIRVRDHGPGIPAAQRVAVFERFHRLEDPMTMRTGGVGIGLFLGRRLAEAMHGTLEIVDTPPGDGAILELRLPVETHATGAFIDLADGAPGDEIAPPRHP